MFLSYSLFFVWRYSVDCRENGSLISLCQNYNVWQWRFKLFSSKIVNCLFFLHSSVYFFYTLAFHKPWIQFCPKPKNGTQAISLFFSFLVSFLWWLSSINPMPHCVPPFLLLKKGAPLYTYNGAPPKPRLWKNYLALEKSCCFPLIWHWQNENTQQNTAGNIPIAANSSIDRFNSLSMMSMFR